MVRRIISRISSLNTQHKPPFIIKIIPYILLLSGCIIGGWYFYMRYTLIPESEKKILSILQTTETDIHAYLSKQEAYTTNLAAAPETKKFFATYSPKNDNKNKLAKKEYAAFLARQQEEMGFKNILLLDINKNFYFSTTRKKLVGTNLNDEAYRTSALNKSYERAMMTITTDFATFLPDPIMGYPALFITAPVINQKKIVGILVYEYNTQDIYRLVNQYIGLGKTGEIALAQKEDDFVVFITPTRNDPNLAFKKINYFNKVPLSIQASVIGQQGIGAAIDYRSQPVIGAWTFLPKVNWGMIVKMDEKEILQPIALIKNLLIFLLLCAIVWAILQELFYTKPITRRMILLNKKAPFNHIPKSLKNPFLLLFIFCCLLILHSTIYHYYKTSKEMSASQQEIVTNTERDAEKIEQILNKIQFTAQSIADDIQASRLSNDDIEKRIKRNITENNTILSITVAFAPYAYDKETKLYAPSISRKDNSYEEKDIAKLYDYTNPHESIAKIKWYQQAVENNSAWINPYTNQKGVSFPPTYSLAFFDHDKQLLGVISIAYDLQTIIRITEYSSLNRAGYSILMTENGKFLFHPVNDFVRSERSLLEVAEESGNEKLVSIARKSLEKKPVLASYTASQTQQQMWLYTHPIAITNWVIGSLFPMDDISPTPHTIRIHYFWILIYTILAGLFLCIFLYTAHLMAVVHTAFLVNFILAAGLFNSWRIIQTTSILEKKDSIIITDQTSLDKFLDDLQEEAKRKNEEPYINIPCGLILYSLELPDTDHMSISGYLWSKYNLIKDNSISQLIELPHATRITIGAPLISKSTDENTISWNIKAIIYEKQNYVYFPFDKQRLQITLEHHDIQRNIILTPDLASYKKLSPEDMPGIDKSFTLSDLHIEQTFFNYKKIDPVASLGFKEYGKATDHFQLIYNIITTRDLLSPFVLFFLPLLVVLFSLFAILLASKRDSNPLSLISSYTGLSFALIVLQRALREQYPANTTLYIEYAFFFTYITIIMLAIHTALIYLYPKWQSYQNNLFPLVKLLFWPFQLISWIVTTLIVFY